METFLKLHIEPESSVQHRKKNQPKEGFLPYAEAIGVISLDCGSNWNILSLTSASLTTHGNDRKYFFP